MNISKSFRDFFLKGLAVLLPSLVTVWLLAWAYQFIQKNFTGYINQGVVFLLYQFKGLPGQAFKDYAAGPGKVMLDGAGAAIGFIVALLIILVVGALLASVVGRLLWRVVEGFIMNTPIVKRVYPYVKQVTDFLLSDKGQQKAFRGVVAVEYPRKGVWAIGFVTGSGFRTVADHLEKEFLTIMMPTSPTPVTGNVIMAPKDEVITLDLTVEEAFRFIMSAGVISPSRQSTPSLPPAQADPSGQSTQMQKALV
jgi:uncharacterized membrane protein